MGLGKVLLIIFLILILIVGVIGVDLYLTYNALSAEDGISVGSPTFEVADNNKTITISVTISTESAGFIPKGLIIVLKLTPEGNPTISSEPVAFNFGESETLITSIELSDSDVAKLADGDSISISLSTDATPTVFGFPIEQLTQTISLGTHTLST
jgi:hypothetical protein